MRVRGGAGQRRPTGCPIIGPMHSWITVAALCPVLAAVGQLIDRLMLRQDKRQLHQRMQGWLGELQQVRARNLPSAAASACIRTFRRLLGPKPSLTRGLVVTVLASWLLTFFAIWLASEQTGFHFVWQFVRGETLWWFVENAFFDFLTLLAFGFLLTRIAHHPGWWLVPYAALTIAVAAGAGIASVETAVWIANRGWVNSNAGVFSYGLHAITYTLRPGSYPPTFEFEAAWFRMFVYLGSTTLVPVAASIAILVVLYAIKLAISTVRFVTIRFFRKMAELEPDKIEPFTVLGLVIGLLGVAAKAVLSLKTGKP